MYYFTFRYLLFTNRANKVIKFFFSRGKIIYEQICFLMLPVNFRFTEYSTQHEKTAGIELWWGEEACIHLLVITFLYVS